MATPVEIDASARIADWLDQIQEEGSQGPNYRVFTQSEDFAALWYDMWRLGWEWCRKALHVLSTNQHTPGGAWPDPLGPRLFSHFRVARQAAVEMGLRTEEVAYELVMPIEKSTRLLFPGLAGEDPIVFAWLMTHGDTHRPLVLYMRTDVLGTAYETHLAWQMACLLGYFAKDYAILTGLGTPERMFTLWHVALNPLMRPLMHRFANALCQERRGCPQFAGCDCHEIEDRLSHTPPEHPQPTDALNVWHLQEQVAGEGARNIRVLRPKYGPSSQPLAHQRRPSGGPRLRRTDPMPGDGW